MHCNATVRLLGVLDTAAWGAAELLRGEPFRSAAEAIDDARIRLLWPTLIPALIARRGIGSPPSKD